MKMVCQVLFSGSDAVQRPRGCSAVRTIRNFLLTLQAHDLGALLTRRFSLIAQVHIRQGDRPGSASKRRSRFVPMRFRGEQEARDEVVGASTVATSC